MTTEQLTMIGLTKEDCIKIDGELWVPVQTANQIIQRVNTSVEIKSLNCAYNHHRYGDVRAISAGRSKLYNVEDLLKVRVWTPGMQKTRRITIQERKKRYFSEQDIQNLRDAQYRRRQREHEAKQ